MTCIHLPTGGLCPACQEAYQLDPSAYLEFGDHPAGLANLAALEAEIAAQEGCPLPAGEDVPL